MAAKKSAKKPGKKSVKKSVKKPAKRTARKSKNVNQTVLIILAILLPPVAVFLKKGAGNDLVINIILCLLLWIPGIIHALWLITK